MDVQFPDATWGDIRAEFNTGAPALGSKHLVDTVLVFVFHDQQFVLANISGRGWTIPGGRIEPGETPSDAANREAYEETGANLLELQEIGFYHLVGKSEVVESDRIVLVFIALAGELNPLPEGFESSGVLHAKLSQLQEIYYIWDPLIEAVCRYAHARALLQGWPV